MAAKVRATRLGYYDDILRRIDDVFSLKKAEDFTGTWMQHVPDATPERHTSAQAGLNALHDQLGVARTRRAPAIDAVTEWDPFR